MRHVTSLLVAVLALAACGGPPGSELRVDDGALKRKQPPPPPPPAALVRFSDVRPTGSFASVTQFELLSTEQVEIAVDWKNVTGIRTQRLDLIAPNGGLYATAYTDFATTTAATGSAVQATPQPDGSYRVWNTLQVAGTTIDLYGMTGTWKVVAALDGAVVSSATFVLY